MFGKWDEQVESEEKAVVEKAEQEKPHEELLPDEPKLVDYRWNRTMSLAVNFNSLALLNLITVTTIYYFLFYWEYNLCTTFWREVVICGLAEAIVICWSLYWWFSLSRRLITAKHMFKGSKWRIFSVILVTITHSIAMESIIKSGISVTSEILFIFICFGSIIIVFFESIWRQYRRANGKRSGSFIEFCNSSSPE